MNFARRKCTVHRAASVVQRKLFKESSVGGKRVGGVRHASIYVRLSLVSILTLACSIHEEEFRVSARTLSGSTGTTLSNEGSTRGEFDGRTSGSSGSGSSGGDATSSGGTESSTGTGSSSAKPGPDANTDSASDKGPFDARAYFNEVLTPLFQTACAECHVGPRVVTTTRGPLSIFNVDAMLALLESGSSASDNPLILRVQNRISHTGGDRCSGNPIISPCKEIRAWGEGVFAAADPGSSTGGGALASLGKLTEGTWDGELIGYAWNPADPSTSVRVEFYAHAPWGEALSVKLGDTLANLPGIDGDLPGNRKFQFVKIDDSQIVSGQPMQIYAYALLGGERQALDGQPFTGTFFVSRDETYFRSNVLPVLQRCSGCHATRTLREAFSLLVRPKPGEDGGSPTNNILYKKASGNDHSGGNQCAGNTCSVIRAWWEHEFIAR